MSYIIEQGSFFVSYHFVRCSRVVYSSVYLDFTTRDNLPIGVDQLPAFQERLSHSAGFDIYVYFLRESRSGNDQLDSHVAVIALRMLIVHRHQIASMAFLNTYAFMGFLLPGLTTVCEKLHTIGSDGASSTSLCWQMHQVPFQDVAPSP
jgi:hypothetical protein